MKNLRTQHPTEYVESKKDTENEITAMTAAQPGVMNMIMRVQLCRHDSGKKIASDTRIRDASGKPPPLSTVEDKASEIT